MGKSFLHSYEWREGWRSFRYPRTDHETASHGLWRSWSLTVLRFQVRQQDYGFRQYKRSTTFYCRSWSLRRILRRLRVGLPLQSDPRWWAISAWNRASASALIIEAPIKSNECILDANNPWGTYAIILDYWWQWMRGEGISSIQGKLKSGWKFRSKLVKANSAALGRRQIGIKFFLATCLTTADSIKNNPNLPENSLFNETG